MAESDFLDFWHTDSFRQIYNYTFCGDQVSVCLSNKQFS